jgi:zona occludens toxin (predicted ATPase)
MPTPTFDLVASYTAPSAQDTVNFASIPGTYKDLFLVCLIKPINNGTAYLGIRFNDSTTNYYQAQVYYTGSVADVYAAADSQIEVVGNQFQTKEAFVVKSEIFSYARTDTFKMSLTSGHTIDNTNRTIAMAWENTAAINKISISTNAAACIAAGSVFSLYGLASA